MQTHTNMKLPENFKNKMINLLGEEGFAEYEKSLQNPMYNCLRVNTLKISVEKFLEISPFELSPVPWTKNAFYYDASKFTPSKHPFYFAGLYYIQEPSACLPAATIPVEPGDKVLDICAAPGGKSTELACKLQGKGLLISNDISASRLKALQKNVEVFGARNVVVTCESPERLSSYFNEYFDKILVDAPCSGEGMFRKSSSMITAWEQNGNEMFAGIQKTILDEVAKMLKPGGTILYSTCTFDPTEDEDQVMYLRKLRPDLKIVPIEKHPGFVEGNPEWSNVEDADESLAGTFHLFPHLIKGEGHYVALLESEEESGGFDVQPYKFKSYADIRAKKPNEDIEDFFKHITSGIDFNLVEIGKDKLFLVPENSPELRGLRIMRRGVYLGELKKKRFEPSQSLAMILKPENFDNVVRLSSDGKLIGKYLRGETLDFDMDENAGEFDRVPDAGWTLICVEDYPLGFGKFINGVLKNKYLPGWRMM